MEFLFELRRTYLTIVLQYFVPPIWVFVIVELVIAAVQIHHSWYVLGNAAAFKGDYTGLQVHDKLKLK